MIQTKQPWEDFPAVEKTLAGADHIDVKQFEGELSLREFIANFINYYPFWLKFLYRVRWLFVRVLGMTQNGIPQPPNTRPQDIPMTAGAKAGFFEVKAAEENSYYIAGGTEPHLTAHLAVVQEPLSETNNRFHVITVVHYHRWTGPVYFNVIRPFHHLVVNRMGLAAIGA